MRSDGGDGRVVGVHQGSALRAPLIIPPPPAVTDEATKQGIRNRFDELERNGGGGWRIKTSPCFFVEIKRSIILEGTPP